MTKFKAIISDIDGTLTAISSTAIPSEKVTAAIKKIVDKGIIFSLATGRPFFMIEYLIKYLNLTSPVITDNGAAIIDSKNSSVLWEALLSHSEALQIIEMAKQYKLTRLSSDIINLENPTEIPKKAKVRKISIHGLTLEEANNLVKKLESKFKNLSINRTGAYEGKKLLDVYISHAQGTKQHAILKLAQLLGISTKEIIGVGDHYNDFPMFMACGLKIAMGNAVPDLKAIADYIAPTVEEDGLAHVLEKYIT